MIMRSARVNANPAARRVAPKNSRVDSKRGDQLDHSSEAGGSSEAWKIGLKPSQHHTGQCWALVRCSKAASTSSASRNVTNLFKHRVLVNLSAICLSVGVNWISIVPSLTFFRTKWWAMLMCLVRVWN